MTPPPPRRYAFSSLVRRWLTNTWCSTCNPVRRKRADLEVQTRLFRDGKLVYEGKPMVPSLTGEAASGRLLAGGHMTLAEGMSPGDYLLQVTVTDKLAKQKYQSASQAVDFEVAR